MKREAERLLKEALRFPPEVRAALAGQLLSSIEQEVDEDAEVAWAAEIARRLKEIDSGAVRAIPWAQARAQILGAPHAAPGR